MKLLQSNKQSTRKIMSEPFADPAKNPDSTQAAKDLRNAVEKDTKKAVSATEEKAQQLKDSASQKANELRGYAEGKAHDFKDDASEKAHHLRDAAEEQWEDTQVRATIWREDTKDYIRENPTQALVTAVGIGFIAGLLVRR